MKILFSVNGIGIGQATRSLAVYKNLDSDVLFVSYGEGYKFLKDKVKVRKVDWFEFKGDNSLNIISTTNQILKNVDLHFKAINKMKKIFYKFKPDVVISDHDLVSIDIARDLGIPAFSILTLYSVKNNYKDIPKKLKSNSLKVQKKVVDLIIKKFERNSNVLFYPSFDIESNYFEKVKITDLIVRERREIRKDNNTIYVSLGGAKLEKNFLVPIVRSLRKIKNYKFVVTGGKRKTFDNVEVYPFLNPFDYLPFAKAVITTAGHSSISEALVYKKPILSLPIINHIEQLSNAVSIKKRKCGDYLLIRDFRREYSEQIIEFLENIETYKRNAEKLKFKGKGAEQIANYILSSIL